MKAPFSGDALNPGVQLREVFGWAMYDFANSGYTTVVLTAVFNAYFVSVVAQGAPWASHLWGTAQAFDTKAALAPQAVASQALRSSTLFAVIPATPKTHLSAGFTYALSNQSKLDFAYSHALEETMSNTSLPNTSAPIQVKHSQNNVVLGYRYSF